MKKKIALLLIVSMMFMLCACGGGNKDANQGGQGEAWKPDMGSSYPWKRS